jgi:hypothetical protein
MTHKVQDSDSDELPVVKGGSFKFNYPAKKFAEDEDKRINNELFFSRIRDNIDYDDLKIGYLDAKPGNSSLTQAKQNRSWFSDMYFGGLWLGNVFTVNWNPKVVAYLREHFRLSDEKCKQGLFVRSIIEHPHRFKAIYYDGETTMDGKQEIPSESGVNFFEQIFKKRKIVVNSVVALTLSRSRKRERIRENLYTHKKYGSKLKISNTLLYYKEIIKRIANRHGYRIRFLKGTRSYRDEKMFFLLFRVIRMI